MTGGNRWVSPVLGTPGQGPHTKPAQGEVLVARHGPENDYECPQLSKVPYFEAKPQIPPLEPILCTEPLDLVHIDYVSMEVTVGVKEKPVVKNVLIVEDHFTHYTQVYVTNNHTACTMVHVLYNEFFSVSGFSRRLMSDQAAEFTGQVISELCDLLGITKIRMLPYHPQTNGAVKRVHQTLRRMIAKMDPDKRAKWPSHLGAYTDCLQCNKVTYNRLLTLLPHVWASTKITSRPSIPDR